MSNYSWHLGIALAGSAILLAATLHAPATKSTPTVLAPPYKQQAVEGKIIPLAQSWPGSRDVYLDVRRIKDPINFGNGSPAPIAAESGYRAVFGPNPSNTGGGPEGATRLASEEVTGPDGQPETAAVVEVEGGYAAIWGYRPRVRMRQIVAGADGTTIIAQYRPGNVQRIYVLDKPDTSKRVTVYESSTNAELFHWTENDSFVDITIDPKGGQPQWGTPTDIRGNAEAERFVSIIREKMK